MNILLLLYYAVVPHYIVYTDLIIHTYPLLDFHYYYMHTYHEAVPMTVHV